MNEGPIVAPSLLDLRSFVAEPMQHGRLFLLGDAAHVITPTGGKVMNLALQGADERAAGLNAHYAGGDDRRLAGYTTTRLPHVWRAHEFSGWMMEMLHADPSSPPGDAYTQRLKDRTIAPPQSRHAWATAQAVN